MKKKHYTLHYDKCAEEEAFRYAGTLRGALVKLKKMSIISAICAIQITVISTERIKYCIKH